MTLRLGLIRRIAEEMLAGCACLEPSAAILLVDPGSEPDAPRPARERCDALWIIPLGSRRLGVRTPSDAAPAPSLGSPAR